MKSKILQSKERNTMLKTTRTVRLLKIIFIESETSDILSDIGIQGCWVKRRKVLSIHIYSPCLHLVSWKYPPNCECQAWRREASDINGDSNTSVALGNWEGIQVLTECHRTLLLVQATCVLGPSRWEQIQQTKQV